MTRESHLQFANYGLALRYGSVDSVDPFEFEDNVIMRAIAETYSEEQDGYATPLPKSGVMRAAKRLPATAKEQMAPSVSARVTLIVHGWDNVEPGTLAWVFPDKHAAVTAAVAMRNAIRWFVVQGDRTSGPLCADLERRLGTILAERS